MKLLALVTLALAPHITTATPVTAVGVTGNAVAYATADCRVHLWDRRARRVTTFGRGPACERTSTGTGVSAVAVAGSRVLFVHYTGGNIREWSLWTATPTSPKPRRLQFATSEPEAAPPLVLGQGHAGVVAWAFGRTVTVVRANGSRAFRWTAPGTVTALAESVRGLTVATEDGHVYSLVNDAVGRIDTFPQPPSAIAVASSAYVVQYGRTLETRGARPRTFTLARTSRLVGSTGGRAVIAGGGAVRTIDLVTGAGALVARGTLAAVDGSTLVTAAGRRLTVSRV